jgi:hypothetical protein
MTKSKTQDRKIEFSRITKMKKQKLGTPSISTCSTTPALGSAPE